VRRRSVLAASAAGVVTMAAGCSDKKAPTSTATSAAGGSLTLGRGGWSYDQANDVYYQIGRSYVGKPAEKDYETLAVFVPGAYFQGTKDSDGTYTTTVSTSGTVGDFTASTAPIVFPVNTPGYAAQKPVTAYSYDDVSRYLQVGFVYVHAGLRGRDSSAGSAPWGVTDLKAAVRYVRHNAAAIPGSKDRMVVFGMSGGGAQSAVMGASGDSALYTPYLQSLGAATDVSDAVAGVMCWCPITNLDYADAAYEWNMGRFATTGTRAAGTWSKQYSADLASAFASGQNRLGLKDSSGKLLTLNASGTGTYYDHVVSVINESLNNFLKDTTFPYATYKTVDQYFTHLNSGGAWVTYNGDTNTARVSNLAGFVKSQKPPSKGVGAFDGPDRGATENLVFGNGTGGLHFSAVSEQVIQAHQAAYGRLPGWKPAYAAVGYASDFKKTDSVGKDVISRGNMYNPMYYLNASYAGHRTSQVAPNWRIRTGITQGDTASTTEINLALALTGYGVANVDFATVWGVGHTMAERSGDATTNFIAWVKATVAK
jgi:hypothetical protein